MSMSSSISRSSSRSISSEAPPEIVPASNPNASSNAAASTSIVSPPSSNPASSNSISSPAAPSFPSNNQLFLRRLIVLLSFKITDKLFASRLFWRFSVIISAFRKRISSLRILFCEVLVLASLSALTKRMARCRSK